jgi:hypothetical protein
VILCRRGSGEKALHHLREIMTKLKRKYPPSTAAWFAVKIGGLAKRELSAAAYYRHRRAAWPFAAVNLPFRLARTASRMLAGNWSTEIQISDDPKSIAQR